MNADRRRELNNAISLLEQAWEIIDNAHYDEADAFNNLPESLQNSEKGEQMEQAADELQTIADEIQEQTSQLQGVIDQY